MTRRTTSFVAVCVWSVVTLLNPAFAQDTVTLSASYQGQFLPEGTEFVVLTKEARVQRDGRHQPEFLPTSGFPRDRAAWSGRDRLGSDGRSKRSYDRTQSSGLLYFIYALAPDSTLYWSYSAQRDSLKYDVVSSGVMSVAPIDVGEIRSEVLTSFFRQRVTVVMPNDRRKSDQSGDAVDRPVSRDSVGVTEESTDPAADVVPSGPFFEDAAATLPSGDDLAASVPAGAAAGHASEEALRIPASVANISATSQRERSGALPPFVAYAILMLLVATAAVPAVLARNYRRELKQMRRETIALRERVASHDPSMDLRRRLQEAELRRKRIEDDYDTLLARYSALKSRVEE